LAVRLFEQHKSGEARRVFEIVQRVAGEHPNVLYYLGRLDLENHTFERAITSSTGSRRAQALGQYHPTMA
jgi:hypothetical protein